MFKREIENFCYFTVFFRILFVHSFTHQQSLSPSSSSEWLELRSRNDWSELTLTSLHIIDSEVFWKTNQYRKPPKSWFLGGRGGSARKKIEKIYVVENYKAEMKLMKRSNLISKWY